MKQPYVAPESVWRPRNPLRLGAGLIMAVGLPLIGVKLVAAGYTDRLPSLAFVAAIVVTSLIGRLFAGLLSILVALLLLEPLVGTADVIDFTVFSAVTLMIAVALATTDRARSTALRQREATIVAQHRLTLIADASRMLAASFDLEQTARQVCQAVVSKAGWDHAIVVNGHRSGHRVIASAHASGGSGNGATDPLEPSEALEAVTEALRTGKTQTLQHNGWRGGRLGRWKYRSGLAIPLLPAADAPAGALVLLHSARGHAYTATDLVFAGELGGRIALAAGSAGQYQKQVHIAHTLQKSLLPRSLPQVPGAEVYVRYQAGAGTEVGGDFYDVFNIGEHRWMVVVADVCGKGPEAATVMGIARATMRALALHEQSPARLLTLLNEALLAQVPDDRFVTACCAAIEIAPGKGAEVRLAQAGHPAPIVVRKGSAPELASAQSGVLLGAFSMVSVSESVLRLDPGDSITFYTDGIEAADVAAPDRALELMLEHGNAPADQIAERFTAAVRTGPAGKADDLVVLTFEFTAKA